MMGRPPGLKAEWSDANADRLPLGCDRLRRVSPWST